MDQRKIEVLAKSLLFYGGFTFVCQQWGGKGMIMSAVEVNNLEVTLDQQKVQYKATTFGSYQADDLGLILVVVIAQYKATSFSSYCLFIDVELALCHT